MCTREEIELKRRMAQEKLARKRLCSTFPPQDSAQIGAPYGASSPSKARFSFKGTPKHDAKPYDKPKAAVSFYGSDKIATLKCSLITEERFVVEMSDFSAPAIEIFKTMATRNYDTKNRKWDFHLGDYNALIAKLQELRVVVERIPQFALSCVNKPKSDYSDIDLSRIDPELSGILMPFQEEGVRFGIDKNGRCLIADEMGLGKTFQALGIAKYYEEDWPLLIVTTSSMKNIWEESIHKYLPSIRLMDIQYMVSGKDYIGDCRVLIISHELMTKALDSLLKRQFGVLVVDESHNLKNSKAKCTKAAQALAKRAKRVILLSGTPLLSRPNELFSQLSLIDEKFVSFYDYSKRYCDGKNTNFGWDSSGNSNPQELEIILTRRFMIRRTKEVLSQMLPNKTQEAVTLDVQMHTFSAEDRRCLQTLAAKYQNQKKSSERHAILLTFFSETARIKIPSVCSYILQVLQNKQKFLVFAHHQIMLDAICQLLSKRSVKHIRIDGSTSSEQRKYLVDKFQTKEDYLTAALSITAANAGITLTAAQLVIFAELHWNPSILSQAESRAHRIGQELPVVIKYLLAPGTADDSIWPMLQNKQKILEGVGLSKESFSKVSVSKQNSNSEGLTENLNITLDRTSANTLDIASYFKSDSKLNISDNCDIFDDGLDDVLGSIAVS